jgi:hypothetical protein
MREQVLEHRDRERGSESRRSLIVPAQPAQRESARRISFTVAHGLWLGSWETALAALATAAQSGTLNTNEVAAHKAAIATEREIVTKQFTLLLGHTLAHRGNHVGDEEYAATPPTEKQRDLAAAGKEGKP